MKTLWVKSVHSNIVSDLGFKPKAAGDGRKLNGNFCMADSYNVPANDLNDVCDLLTACDAIWEVEG